MSTVRTKKNKNYTTISNVVLNDVALSWKAKGLAAYLLSKPDEWKIQREHLAKQSEDGISAVRSTLQELERFGYLVRQKTHNEKGIIEWEYVLHEEPQNREPLREKGGVRKKKGAKPVDENQPMEPSADNPPVENPPVENPPVENPPVENLTLVNTDVVNTDVASTEKESARADPVVEPPPPTPTPATPTSTSTPPIAANGKTPRLPNDSADMPLIERVVSVTPKRGRPAAKTLSPHVKDAKFTESHLVEPGTGTNPVAAYYEFYSIYDYRLSARVEDDLPKVVTDLTLWREVVMEWQQCDHRPTYIRGMLDWYHYPERRPSQKFAKSADKPLSSPTEQTLNFNWEEV